MVFGASQHTEWLEIKDTGWHLGVGLPPEECSWGSASGLSLSDSPLPDRQLLQEQLLLAHFQQGKLSWMVLKTSKKTNLPQVCAVASYVLNDGHSVESVSVVVSLIKIYLKPQSRNFVKEFVHVIASV